MKSYQRISAFGLVVLLSLVANLAHAMPKWCIDKPVKFAGITWESGQFFTEVARIIVEKGYGCKTEVVPGDSPTTEAALIANELQVWMETWGSELLLQGRNRGKINLIGNVLVGGTVEGWFVPEYLVKGDDKRGIKPLAPTLNSVAQLANYTALFNDDAHPGKGRFLNCPAGWTCAANNTQKLKAYKLAMLYTDVRPADGAALDTQIAAAYERGEPLLFYYWGPTAFMSKYRLLQLQEPAYSAACWNTISKNVTNYVCGSATPPKALQIGVSILFQNNAPELVEFFNKISLPLDTVNRTLHEMNLRKLGGDVVARDFMKNNKTLWKQWVPEDVGAKIERAL